MVARLAIQQGFILLLRCWVVERTCVWLGRYRRVRKDDAQRPEDSEAWVYRASIARMLHTLHPNQRGEPPRKRAKRKLQCRSLRNSSGPEALLQVCTAKWKSVTRSNQGMRLDHAAITY